jgi:pimeloyl-ACP methyl ester carboxylesterase
MRHRWNAVLKLLAGLLFCCSLTVAKEKPAIVLVHGAFQDGPKTSPRVEPELKAKGYRVVVVNPPGRDSDGSDPQKLTTENYKQAVLKAISSEIQPIILVGHSFGGITISNVAQAAPEKIKALVYLSAYLPRNGDSLQSLSQTDKDSKLGQDGTLLFRPITSTQASSLSTAATFLGVTLRARLKRRLAKA